MTGDNTHYTPVGPHEPWYKARPWYLRSLMAALGVAGVNYHDDQMQHMRERIADVRNTSRDHYEELQQHCFERQIDPLRTRQP